jgi:hypothetical protein
MIHTLDWMEKILTVRQCNICRRIQSNTTVATSSPQDPLGTLTGLSQERQDFVIKTRHRIRKSHGHGVSAFHSVPLSKSMDLLSQIKQAGVLFSQGIIDGAEFTAIKARLLSPLPRALPAAPANVTSCGLPTPVLLAAPVVTTSRMLLSTSAMPSGPLVSRPLSGKQASTLSPLSGKMKQATLHSFFGPSLIESGGKSYQSLNDHMVTEAQRYDCTTCGKHFAQKRALTNHVKIHKIPEEDQDLADGRAVNRGSGKRHRYSYHQQVHLV